MTPNQLHILQHSLGCDQYGHATKIYRDENDGCFNYYRNRYVSDPDPNLIALVEMGYMEDRGSYGTLTGGMHCYMVTKEGVAAMKRESPERPYLSRSQRRYRAFLDADGCLTFGEWLKCGGYKERAAR